LGEIFHRERSEEALAWTGERLVTGIEGQIESEHLHRYFLARSLCRGKDVLDIASGEGYGTALLAQTAANAIGVDLDSASVEYATRVYRSANLRYIQGEATQIPLESESVDVIVSFETIEHFFDHESFLKEARRVLRPSGFMIISTPDTETYSGVGTPPNPFHKRELTKAEFLEELHSEFSNVSMLRQRIISGSAILADAAITLPGQTWIYEQRETNTFETHRHLPRAPYLLAIASQGQTPPIAGSLYIQTNGPAGVYPEVAAELARLQAVETAIRDQSPLIQQAINDAQQEAATARSEAAKAASALPLLEAEINRLRESEATLREQAAASADAMSSAAGVTREEVARLSSAVPLLEAEIERLRNSEIAFREQAARREATLIEEKDDALREAETLRHQCNTADLLARQQALVVRRLQQDLTVHQRDLALLRDATETVSRCQETNRTLQHELDDLRVAYDQICRLIIPVWMRKAIPATFRSPLRMFKRAMRNG
jgi:2-polyprenyl-3-methyl-5-hydroxy-6-metoxy-1,4-benzoquinol methylase